MNARATSLDTLVELDCGHVPQLERPADTHAAIKAFFTERAGR